MQTGQPQVADTMMWRLLERARSSVMVRQGMVVFAASMVVNVAGFVFHAIASRRLGVDSYGMLYALISASTIATLPGALLAPVIMRFAAEFRALHDDAHVRRLCLDVGRGFTLFGLAYVIVGLIGGPQIAAFFHVPVWTIPLTAAISATMIISNTLRAAAQGTQDFMGYAFSVIFEGILKIGALAVLVTVGAAILGGLLGGLLGFLAGLVAGLVVIVWRLTLRYGAAQAVPVRYDWRRIALSGAGTAVATIGMTIMASGDVVLVKHFFTASQAGIYGAAALGGKMLLYFVSFAPTVLLPQATDRHVRGLRTRGVIAGTLALIVVLAAVVLVVMRLYGLVILHVLVGHAYDAAAPLLVWYATAMGFFSATSLLTSYGIATHRLAFAIPLLLCTFATMAGIVWYHATLEAVMQVFVAGNAVTALVVGVAIAVQGARSLHDARSG